MRSLLQMVALGGVHRRVELDQHVAGLDRVAVAHVDGAHDPGLERLDHFGAAGGMILPGAVATMSTVPKQAQASASRTAAMIVAPIARPIGEGGVSTISSAAGRNASSCVAAAALRTFGNGTTLR